MRNNTGQNRKSTVKIRLMPNKVFLYIPKIPVLSTKHIYPGMQLSKQISCSSPRHALQQQWLGVYRLAAAWLMLMGKLWWVFESATSAWGCPKGRQTPTVLCCRSAPGAASSRLTLTAQAGNSQYCSCLGKLCATAAVVQSRLLSGNACTSPYCQD